MKLLFTLCCVPISVLIKCQDVDPEFFQDQTTEVPAQTCQNEGDCDLCKSYPYYSLADTERCVCDKNGKCDTETYHPFMFLVERPDKVCNHDGDCCDKVSTYRNVSWKMEGGDGGVKCYCKKNKVCNINKEGFHMDNYCLRDENCYNYLPCWEKRMTKSFNETCQCNNGLDGTNTCDFVEKKYDLVDWIVSFSKFKVTFKESCVHWVDTYFGKPIPTTVNPWDARGDLKTEEPVYIGKVYDLLQTAPGTVKSELDGRNGITIAWNKSIETDDNVCYRGLYLFSDITIFRELDTPESSGLDKAFLYDSRWCPYFLHDIEVLSVPGKTCQFAWIPSHSGQVIRAAVKGGHDDGGKDVYICRVLVEYKRQNVPFPVTVSSIGIMHPKDKVCYYSDSSQMIVAIQQYDLLIAKPTSYDDDFDEKECIKWESTYSKKKTPWNAMNNDSKNPVFVGRKKLSTGEILPGMVFPTVSLYSGPCSSLLRGEKNKKYEFQILEKNPKSSCQLQWEHQTGKNPLAGAVPGGTHFNANGRHDFICRFRVRGEGPIYIGAFSDGYCNCIIDGKWSRFPFNTQKFEILVDVEAKNKYWEEQNKLYTTKSTTKIKSSQDYSCSSKKDCPKKYICKRMKCVKSKRRRTRIARRKQSRKSRKGMMCKRHRDCIKRSRKCKSKKYRCVCGSKNGRGVCLIAKQ